MPNVWETNFTKTFHNHSYPAISPTRPELSVAGKTILISGGGRGLGTGVVEAFAQAGAAHIVVTGRNTASLQTVAARIEAAYRNTKVTPVSGDVSSGADVARAFAVVAQVDVVVANAAYLAGVTTITAAQAGEDPDAFVDDWWRSYEVNVKGVLLLARQFLAHAAPNGVFINVSAGGVHCGPPGISAYGSSKLAAVRVVETLQVENPPLRFYSVHPGVVKTDMLIQSGFDALNPPLDDIDLPGNFIVWLASSEGEWLKGRFLWVNWDVEELKAKKEDILSGNKLVTGLLGWE
ncbi:NAD(P)-binding protein [Auricularia subglabra TFB-10046 SS5]|nr:NAD(P)-binding protein [Auricularia subglabra TFB-10046 SS5]